VQPSTARAETRVSRYDWETLSAELSSSYGCAVIEQLLTPDLPLAFPSALAA
jgi:hypothetical protein